MSDTIVDRVQSALYGGRTFTVKQLGQWFGAKNPTRVINYLRTERGLLIDTYPNREGLKNRYHLYAGF